MQHVGRQNKRRDCIIWRQHGRRLQLTTFFGFEGGVCGSIASKMAEMDRLCVFTGKALI